MRRRDFIKIFAGSAAAWPVTARGQRPGMPIIGFLSLASAEGYRAQMTAFRQGLQQSGYVEGRNVAIDYRLAEGRVEQLAALAADLGP